MVRDSIELIAWVFQCKYAVRARSLVGWYSICEIKSLSTLMLKQLVLSCGVWSCRLVWIKSGQFYRRTNANGSVRRSKRWDQMTTTLPCWPPSSSSSSSVFPRREEDDAKWARRVFVLIKIFFLSDSSELTAQKKVAIKNEMKTADVARWLKTTLLVMISNQRRMMFHFAIVGLTVQRSNSNFKMLESKKKFSLLRKAIRNEWKMMDLFIFSLSTSPIHTPVGWIQISSFYFSSLSRELSRVHNKTAPELLETKKKIKKTTQRIQKRWRRDTKKKVNQKFLDFARLTHIQAAEQHCG